MKVFHSHFLIDEMRPTTMGNFGKLGMGQLPRLLFRTPSSLSDTSNFPSEKVIYEEYSGTLLMRANEVDIVTCRTMSEDCGGEGNLLELTC